MSLFDYVDIFVIVEYFRSTDANKSKTSTTVRKMLKKCRAENSERAQQNLQEMQEEESARLREKRQSESPKMAAQRRQKATARKRKQRYHQKVQ